MDDRQIPSRRSFLDWLLGTSLGGSVAMMFYPVFRYLLPPEVAEAPSVTSTVGRLSEVPVRTGKIVRFGATPALIVRKADGSLLAFGATCTHLSCTVQYRPDLEQIWCACHNGIYDLTGKNVSGPPPRPLTPLKVNVVNEEIVLSRA